MYFEWERLPGNGVQDGFDFVATDAWYVGDEPYRRPRGPDTGSFSTSLTITLDDDPDRNAQQIPSGVSPEEYFRQLPHTYDLVRSALSAIRRDYAANGGACISNRPAAIEQVWDTVER